MTAPVRYRIVKLRPDLRWPGYRGYCTVEGCDYKTEAMDYRHNAIAMSRLHASTEHAGKRPGAGR